MEKPVISLKINGVKRAFYENESDKLEEIEGSQKGDVEEEQQNVDDPFLVTEEVAASNEDSEFEWVLPNQTQDIYKGLPVPDRSHGKKESMFDTIYVPSKQKKKKRQPYPVKTFLLAFVSAIVIGASFGMVVLHLFTGTGTKEELGTQVEPVNGVLQPPDTNTVPVTEEGELGDVKETEEPPLLFPIPPLNVYLVQGGLYSSVAAVTPIVDEMKAVGLAGTVINQDGKYYLFLGIGTSDETVKAIRKPYEEYVTDAFVKNQTTRMKEGNQSILQARQLFDQLLSFTTTVYTAMPNKLMWDEVMKTYETLNSNHSNSTEDLFVQSVKAAFVQVEVYKTTSASQDFWASQQALLNCYQLYQKWIFESEKME